MSSIHPIVLRETCDKNTCVEGLLVFRDKKLTSYELI